MPIERLSPELDRLVSADQELEELGNGYEVAEGPLWWQEAGHLIFSEVRGNKRWQWTPGSGITLLQESTNNANGLTRDLQGRMILCEGGAGKGDADGAGRQHHGGGQQVPGHAIEPAQRRGGKVVGREHLFY